MYIDAWRAVAYAWPMMAQAQSGRSITDYVLFAVAWLGLAIASAAVQVVPFRTIFRWMERKPGLVIPAASPPQIVRAVRRAAARSPWRALCIEQGMVAHRMMRRAGYCSQFVYGLSSPVDPLRAHVWLRLDGEVILGGEGMADFQEVVALPR